MLVVPLPRDSIETDDGAQAIVSSFTPFKDKGPAVYVVREPGDRPMAVYFSDIAKINDVKVTYVPGSRVFKSLGKIKRKVHLPQRGDTVVVSRAGEDPDTNVFSSVEVEELKLMNKAIGETKGITIKGEDGNWYTLPEIVNLERAVGGERFDKRRFLRYYQEYVG